MERFFSTSMSFGQGLNMGNTAFGINLGYIHVNFLQNAGDSHQKTPYCSSKSQCADDDTWILNACSKSISNTMKYWQKSFYKLHDLNSPFPFNKCHKHLKTNKIPQTSPQPRKKVTKKDCWRIIRMSFWNWGEGKILIPYFHLQSQSPTQSVLTGQCSDIFILL